MTKYLFPFEQIKKDGKIIVYGAGVVGQSFLSTLRATNYCEVVAVLDENKAGTNIGGFNVRSPEAVASFLDTDYDVILVASITLNVQMEVLEYLKSKGVPNGKIIVANGNKMLVYGQCKLVNTDDFTNLLRIAVIPRGGLGDFLIVNMLITALRKAMANGLKIDVYVESVDLFKNLPFIDCVYAGYEYLENNEYDVVLETVQFNYISKFNPEKVRRMSDKLFAYFSDLLWFYKILGLKNDPDIDAVPVLRTFEIFEKKRIETANLHGILPYNRFSPTYCEFNADAFEFLKKLELAGKAYITICSTVSEISYRNHIKLWPTEHFRKLVFLLKEQYPELLIVRIGIGGKAGEIGAVDFDLCGGTSFDELCVLLKHSILHIGCEGGLVHLKHFLNGHSACLFGPSVPQFLGYDENINIRSNCNSGCANGCENMGGWNNGRCLLSFDEEYALCMRKLAPEQVFQSIKGFLDNYSAFRYVFERSITADELKEMFFVGCKVALIGRKGDDVMIPMVSEIGSITVYDRDLSDNFGAKTVPINAGYYSKMAEKGIAAEYGSLYNIPSASEAFDFVFSFTMPDEKSSEFALQELLRVIKFNGKAITLNGNVFAVYTKLPPR